MKYHNIKVLVDGVKYDSKKEYRRAEELNLLLKAKLISNLQRQVRYELQPSFKRNGETIRKIEYIADFVYYDEHLKTTVAEDVKSEATRKDKVYAVKKKLFMYKYPTIDFREII